MWLYHIALFNVCIPSFFFQGPLSGLSLCFFCFFFSPPFFLESRTGQAALWDRLHSPAAPGCPGGYHLPGVGLLRGGGLGCMDPRLYGRWTPGGWLRLCLVLVWAWFGGGWLAAGWGTRVWMYPKGGGQMVPLGCVQRIPRRTGAPSSPVAVYFGHDVLFGRVARGSTHRLLPVKKKSPFIPRELFRQFLPRLRIFHTLGRKCPGDGHFLFFTFLFFSRGFVGFLQPNDGPCVFLYIYFPCLFLFPQVQPAVHAARQRQQGEDV